MANNDLGQIIRDGFIARGFTPVQAAVLAGNMQQESSFNPAAYNPNEDAFGGFQWRLDRKTGLENYAKATGRAANDIEAQMDWVVQEMTGPEARSAAPFLAATTPEAANAAIKKYIRWGDNSDATRLQNAMAYMGTPAQAPAVAAINAAAPQPAPPMPGNALTGDAGFVNPAFGNSPFQMPPAAAPLAAPVMATPIAPAPAVVPIAPATPAAQPSAPALSDDDLLKLFLPTPAEGMGGALRPQPSPVPAESASDDDLLKLWLPAVAPAPAPSAAQQFPTDANGMIDAGNPMVAQPPAAAPVNPAAPRGNMPNLVGFPGFGPLLGAVGYDGRPIPESASMVPALDPINAFANAAVNAVPVLGPKLNEMGTQFDAAVNNMLTGQSQTPEERAQVNAATAEAYPVASTAGTVAGTVGPFAAAGTVPAAARLLGMSGPTAARIGFGMGSGALMSGADTVARGGTLEQAGKNALIGGTIGGALPAAGAVVNSLIAPAVSPRVAQLAQLARDRFGIEIGPGQISGNPSIRFLDDVVNKIPLSGGTASREAQQAAFNRSVANSFGETADAITPDVLEAATTRIGTMFDDVAAQTPVIRADPTFDQQMLDAMTTAQQTLTDAELVPLGRQFDALVGKFQQGGNAIDGATYQALTRKGTPLDLALHSNNPNIRHVAGDFREALDGALERSAAPDVLADLQTARAQWKALKTVQRLAEKGPIGDVSPALLQNAVITSYNGMPTAGVGADLANLARIGQQFLKAPASSGTAERMAIINMLTKGGAAAGGLGALALNPGMIIPAAVTAGATLATGRGLGAVLRSPQLANMLIRSGANGPRAAGNALVAPAVPAMLGPGGPEQVRPPLRIVVDGANPLMPR